MATANNGNNNINTEDVKEAVASTVKNDGMQRPNQPTANSTRECKFGADCTNMKQDHMDMYTHRHMRNCRFQPNCTNKSEEHHRQFVHTVVVATIVSSTTKQEECKFGADCTNMKQDHMDMYTHRHMRNCKFNPNCTNKSEEHRAQFVHTIVATIVSATTKQKECKFGADCTNMKQDHIEKYSHPLMKNCKEVHHCLYCYNNKNKTVFKCPYEHTSSTRTPLGWCKFGADCKNTLPYHMEKYIHPTSGNVFWDGKIANYPVENCHNNPNCTDKSEEHLQ